MSKGTGKIIAKTRWECGVGRDVTVTEALIRLYQCSQKPSGPEKTWTTQYGCRVVKSASYLDDLYVPANGKTNPRYVPKVGDPGASGTGWWIQCTQYYRSDNPGVKYRNASIARYLTA
ncbi:hypothetical protein [Actinopolyspora mortivallis]|uniref:hypothetical protein n=1 Tax=Actinopolyspora mortivallis TaxID=33906 RepID=UPI0012EE5E7C|nr:hypothetical protein [Actinopolyspora mortivallis]